MTNVERNIEVQNSNTWLIVQGFIKNKYLFASIKKQTS